MELPSFYVARRIRHLLAFSFFSRLIQFHFKCCICDIILFATFAGGEATNGRSRHQRGQRKQCPGGWIWRRPLWRRRRAAISYDRGALVTTETAAVEGAAGRSRMFIITCSILAQFLFQSFEKDCILVQNIPKSPQNNLEIEESIRSFPSRKQRSGFLP